MKKSKIKIALVVNFIICSILCLLSFLYDMHTHNLCQLRHIILSLCLWVFYNTLVISIIDKTLNLTDNKKINYIISNITIIIYTVIVLVFIYYKK